MVSCVRCCLTTITPPQSLSRVHRRCSNMRSVLVSSQDQLYPSDCYMLTNEQEYWAVGEAGGGGEGGWIKLNIARCR